MRAQARSAPALFPAGEILGRFVVEGVLGIGGTGTVFQARDLELGRDVAVKAIPHDATLRQRARREAAVAKRLDHPNVVRLHDVLEDDEYVYVISELVDGGDLLSALRGGELSDIARVRVVAAVCSALAHAHERGVVHRDVKPANVLLGSDGSVRLADFGIAAIADPDATVDDRMLGTLSYMAPETCKGDPPAAPADVWGAGILLYESLSGANPFRARTPEELTNRHGARARPLAEVRPDLPRAVVNACSRALNATPRKRPSAAALGQALESAADAMERASGRRGGVRQEIAAAVIPLQRHAPSVDVGGLAGRSLAGLGALLSRLTHGELRPAALARAEAIAARLGPPACAVLAVVLPLRLLPFWPASFLIPIAVACGLAALVSPWLGALLTCAAVLPAVGNVSAGAAWSLGALAALWLLLCAGAGRRALLPALAPPLAAVLAWPAYLALAGRRRTLPGRLLAGAAGPLAIALWQAGPGALAPLQGVESASHVSSLLAHGGGAPLAAQALGWGLAAAAWPFVWRVAPARRALLVAAWLSLALLAQAILPGLGGRAPEPVWASVGAVWIAGIVVWLAVDVTGGAASGAESRS